VTQSGPTLWLVATPIGNLADLPPRAVEVLSTVGLVCCEDTRRTGRLLQHAGIRAERLAVANEHTEASRVGEVLAMLGAGRDVAVVTDAGTPGISDPGERLVRAAIDAGHRVAAVPGPAAALVALTISGLPTARFVFEGFLPRSGRQRQQRLAEVAAERRTVVLYEAPHRVVRTLADLADACGVDRPIAVCRELTKLYEEVVRRDLGSIDIGEPRGEYVLVLGGAPPVEAESDEGTIRRAIEAELDAGATTRDASSVVSVRLGVPRRTVYALATKIGSHRRAT
jgi:16S rRNA (cytidine1402-2'-O)-methyltransferase